MIRMTFPEVESFLRAYEDFFEAHESLEGFAHPGPLPLPLIQLQHAYNDVVALLELTPDANGHLQEAPPALPPSFELLCAGFYARLIEDQQGSNFNMP